MATRIVVPPVVPATCVPWPWQSSAAPPSIASNTARGSHRARAMVDRALAGGTDPVDLALEVLCPALRTIGEQWEHGDVSIAQEHYATGITEGVMAVLADRMRRPPRGGRGCRRTRRIPRPRASAEWLAPP